MSRVAARKPRRQPDAPMRPYCARYHRAIEILGRRWTGSILRVLLMGPHRFNEILTSIPGLSDRLLTERLRQLEEEALVVRQVSTDRPVQVAYQLTDRGHDLQKVVRAIKEWADRWMGDEE
jgi:DNA-binding HxlR family transcriptional regulator